jgi:hypothetical protein
MHKKETITVGKQQLQNSFKGFTFIGTTINEKHLQENNVQGKNRSNLHCTSAENYP